MNPPVDGPGGIGIDRMVRIDDNSESPRSVGVIGASRMESNVGIKYLLGFEYVLRYRISY
jgi:hypothetical protein